MTPRRKKPNKPKKPYVGFPLTPHGNGQWCKRIRGELHYFGPWGDWKAALAKYHEQKDDLHAGRKPRVKSEDGLTLGALCNRFLTAKALVRDAGGMTTRTWNEYKTTLAWLVECLGTGRFVADLAADDFEELYGRLTKSLGVRTVSNEIQRVRTVFKFAFENGLIPAPVRFGTTFRKPTKTQLRKHRAKKPVQLFEPHEIHALLAVAATPMKAMILLGINCGFGNSDCGNLPQTALDCDAGWVTFPRPKTGIERRCPLWDETVAALRAALAERPSAQDAAHAGLVFITQKGLPWASEKPGSPVGQAFTKLVRKAKVKAGRGFYALRHSFRTVADASLDQPAIDRIMGHETSGISTAYRERIGDARLVAVANVVHAWLCR